MILQPMTPTSPAPLLSSQGDGDESPDTGWIMRWAKPARGILLGAATLVALLHLTAAPGARLQTWPLSYLVLEVLACASLSYRAWKTSGEGRFAWWLLATSALLEVPNLLLTFLELRGIVSAQTASLSSYLSLATGVLVLAGVLSFPKAQERGGMVRRRALDSLIFAASLLFLLWVMGVPGFLRTAAQGVGLRVFAAYMNAALLGGALVFMTSYHPGRTKGPLGWLGASALAWLAALSCWTLAGLPSVVASQAWILLAGGIPLFQGLAAWSSRSVKEALTEPAPEHRLTNLLPYVPVSFAIAVLAMLLVWAPLQITRAAMAIALAMVVLILMRQFMAITDLQAARRTLEDRVLQRTKSLERMQDLILKTERMNALATLGAGLAHDLNNLLGVIRNSAELMQLELEEGQPPSNHDLSRIMDASGKAGSLTQRLMAFVRKEPGLAATVPMELAEIVQSIQGILRMILPRTIHLECRIEPATHQLQIDAGMVEQVLVNLVSNAKDALPEGGKITLLLRPGQMPGGGEAVVLEVRDTGPGIPVELQELIFDAFYTTKPEGKGTGLGLASVRGLMEAQGGTVSVECPPGQGTIFSLSFPIPV
ncbi:MAG: HAMP domain-containing sensor histidine kinase [Holophaga sp.]